MVARYLPIFDDDGVMGTIEEGYPSDLNPFDSIETEHVVCFFEFRVPSEMIKRHQPWTEDGLLVII